MGTMSIIFLTFFGLAWGSFVNAAVWRLHELETRKKLTKKQKNELSIARGRSMCVQCKHTLAWYDLIPVVSWVGLRGKCRYCHGSISWQYPVVELLTAGLFVWSYAAWPFGFDAAGWLLFVFWLVFLVGFVALAVYDLKWMELPNKVVYPLTGLAVLQLLAKAVVTGNIVGAVVGASLGFLVIGGLFYGLFQLSGGKWIGGGDVKLAFMIGPLVGGGFEALMVIFFASVMGTLVSLPLMARKSLRVSSRIPFGPFLLAATIVVYLYSERIISWYSQGLL
jgi:prepilin signal peptidase PulO-like enzyme (type II secretory pathway)